MPCGAVVVVGVWCEWCWRVGAREPRRAAAAGSVAAASEDGGAGVRPPEGAGEEKRDSLGMGRSWSVGGEEWERLRLGEAVPLAGAFSGMEPGAPGCGLVGDRGVPEALDLVLA